MVNIGLKATRMLTTETQVGNQIEKTELNPSSTTLEPNTLGFWPIDINPRVSTETTPNPGVTL